MVKPIRTFTVTPSLPPELERQRALVYNLRWAWNHDAIELFRWDSDLWEQSGHNPALMLGTVDQETLQAAASDEGFPAHLNRVSNDFDAYLKSESTWFRRLVFLEGYDMAVARSMTQGADVWLSTP